MRKEILMPARIYLFTLLSIFVNVQFVFSQQIKSINAINNQRNIDFNCALQDKNGFIWFGTDKGLIRFDGEKYKVFDNVKGLVNSPVKALFIDKANVLWMGHVNGKVTLFKEDKFIGFSENNKLGNSAITSFVEHNGIWIGTYGEGVYSYTDAKKIVHFNMENGMSDNAVYALCTDKSNNIWAATDGGLTHFMLKKTQVDLEIISMKKGLPDNIVRNILLAKNGELIIAMQDSGICAYNIQSNNFKKCTGWKFGPVNSIVEFEPQVFYVATEKNGVFKCVTSNKKLGAISKLSYTETVDTRNLNMLFKDREDNLWILKKSGLILLSQSRWKLFQAKNGLQADTILSVLIDSKNNCWIGSSIGLQVYTVPSVYENMPANLTLKEKVFDKEVTCIYEDIYGNIWFGTYGFGLYKYNPATQKLKSIPLRTRIRKRQCIMYYC